MEAGFQNWECQLPETWNNWCRLDFIWPKYRLVSLSTIAYVGRRATAARTNKTYYYGLDFIVDWKMFVCTYCHFLNKSVLSLIPRFSTWRYQQPQLGRLQISVDIWRRLCCRQPGCGKVAVALSPAADISTGQTDGRTDMRPFYDADRILCGPRNNRTCVWCYAAAHSICYLYVTSSVSTPFASPFNHLLHDVIW